MLGTVLKVIKVRWRGAWKVLWRVWVKLLGSLVKERFRSLRLPWCWLRGGLGVLELCFKQGCGLCFFLLLGVVWLLCADGYVGHEKLDVKNVADHCNSGSINLLLILHELD